MLGLTEDAECRFLSRRKSWLRIGRCDCSNQLNCSINNNKAMNGNAQNRKKNTMSSTRATIATHGPPQQSLHLAATRDGRAQYCWGVRRCADFPYPLQCI